MKTRRGGNLFRKLWEELMIMNKGNHEDCEDDINEYNECRKKYKWTLKWRPCKLEYNQMKRCNHYNNARTHANHMSSPRLNNLDRRYIDASNKLYSRNRMKASEIHFNRPLTLTKPLGDKYGDEEEDPGVRYEKQIRFNEAKANILRQAARVRQPLH